MYCVCLVFSFPVFAKYEEHLSTRDDSSIPVIIRQHVYESNITTKHWHLVLKLSNWRDIWSLNKSPISILWNDLKRSSTTVAWYIIITFKLKETRK